MTVKQFWDKYYIAVIFVIVSILMGVVFLFVTSATDQSNYSKVDILSGDSVWQLAERHAEEAKMDKASFVAWVEKNNNLDSNDIKAGESLVIPVKEKQIKTDATIQLANE